MLSDEERKVMDSLKVISEYAGDNYLAKEHRRKLKLLIELVEKQSKEIEELKQEKDKIKAKIEEVNDGIKRDMINYDKIKDESWKLAIHRSMTQKIEIKKVLQSLLEKE